MTMKKTNMAKITKVVCSSTRYHRVMLNFAEVKRQHFAVDGPSPPPLKKQGRTFHEILSKEKTFEKLLKNLYHHARGV